MRKAIRDAISLSEHYRQAVIALQHKLNTLALLKSAEAEKHTNLLWSQGLNCIRQMREWNEKAQELCATELPKSGNNCVKSFVYTEHTQGLGAYKYTKERATRFSERLGRLGIVSEIYAHMHKTGEEIPLSERPYIGGTMGSCYLSVHYWIDDEDLDPFIIEHTSYGYEELVETVRKCWARGVNPRVYFPFLPHGYEAQHGLDYFGNKVVF